MKVALVGTGQMGAAVESIATQRGHEVVAWFNTRIPFREAETVDALQGADVVIDFSLPHTVLAHIEKCCQWQCPIVVGTTGWYDQMEKVKEWVQSYDASLLYAPNFSMGIALLAHAVRSITPLLEQLPEMDVAVHETHHIRKTDSPGGTALMLGQMLVEGLSRKTHVETETQHQRIALDALHVTAARLGGVIGSHTVRLDGPFDHLTLTHEAKTREGFAFGAVRAAEWLAVRKGFFTLEDLLEDWLLHTMPSSETLR